MLFYVDYGDENKIPLLLKEKKLKSKHQYYSLLARRIKRSIILSFIFLLLYFSNINIYDGFEIYFVFISLICSLNMSYWFKSVNLSYSLIKFSVPFRILAIIILITNNPSPIVWIIFGIIFYIGPSILINIFKINNKKLKIIFKEIFLSDHAKSYTENFLFFLYGTSNILLTFIPFALHNNEIIEFNDYDLTIVRAASFICQIIGAYIFLKYSSIFGFVRSDRFKLKKRIFNLLLFFGLFSFGLYFIIYNQPLLKMIFIIIMFLSMRIAWFICTNIFGINIFNIYFLALISIFPVISIYLISFFTETSHNFMMFMILVMYLSILIFIKK